MREETFWGGRTARRAHGGAAPRAALLAALVAAALAAVGLAASAAPAAASTLWLCKPGSSENPCLTSETATVELPNGSSFVEHAKPASNPPIDCFYVYPTVSGAESRNAPVAVEPEERQIAIDQASRFSQACKVYAPIYPQITIAALNKHEITAEAVITAYVGVVSAFDEYLAKYNRGRDFVLVGHSQGAAMLIRLIKEQVDPNPTLRAKLVSAILLGGNVTVPTGQTVGGSFANIPTCESATQFGCVIAYSSFLETPPANSLFGRAEPAATALSGSPGGPGYEVVCSNPTVLAEEGQAGPAFSYYSTEPFPGPLGFVVQVPHASTPWVATPDEYNGRCDRAEGATWLQLEAAVPGDTREPVLETLGPEWGTHLVDLNVAFGNLVALARAKGAALLASQG